MPRAGFVTALLAVIGSSASAQDAPPLWVNPPSMEAASDLMPEFADLIAVAGRVRLKCRAIEQGLPRDCIVLQASPAGLGFDHAAIAVAGTGVIRPRMVNGKFVPTEITFAVHFGTRPLEDMDDGVTPYSGPAPTAAAIELARRIARENLAEQIAMDRQSMLEGLAADRLVIVARWIDDLLPVDDALFVERVALTVARLSSEADMSAYLADRTLPSTPAPDAAALDAASSDQFDPADQAGLIALRARYCATWSCDIEPDHDLSE